ncbi:30S ribosomal protein S14 [Candidatus Woesearchaeota archaeon]|nr:30S ribosomal protein S14 [Candidatus Woesearchaeota archaeon]
MTVSYYKKAFKQLKAKPVKLKKFLKHNEPAKRSCGVCNRRCTRCGRFKAHIRKYGVHLCRQCFRETASLFGFKKFS